MTTNSHPQLWWQRWKVFHVPFHTVVLRPRYRSRQIASPRCPFVCFLLHANQLRPNAAGWKNEAGLMSARKSTTITTTSPEPGQVSSNSGRHLWGALPTLREGYIFVRPATSEFLEASAQSPPMRWGGLAPSAHIVSRKEWRFRWSSFAWAARPLGAASSLPHRNRRSQPTNPATSAYATWCVASAPSPASSVDSVRRSVGSRGPAAANNAAPHRAVAAASAPQSCRWLSSLFLKTQSCACFRETIRTFSLQVMRLFLVFFCN